MKTKFRMVIGIIIFVVYLPIHYPFLRIGSTTEIFVFCEDGFIQHDNKCAPDSKISKETSREKKFCLDLKCHNHII